MNLPPKEPDANRQVFAESLGRAPGRGRLQGRRVIVVGAGQRTIPEADPPVGNGRAISVLFAREGAHVACVGRDEAAARATCDQVASEGGKAFADVTDVRGAHPGRIGDGSSRRPGSGAGTG